MPESPSRSWSLPKRIGYRALLAYLFLFFFPFPAGLVNPGWLGGAFDRVWARVIPWFGGLLHIGIPRLNNGGSGDSTFDQLRVVCMAIVAMAAAAVWSFVDRKRADYRTLNAYARIWMRYVLAVCMLTYGSVKVLMVQFEPPGYGRLIQPVGEMSPMALLWTFMGSSALYTTFTGVTEVAAGLLLLFRRTTTLGALVAAAIMTNVFVLNLSYDVPVKLGSLHILILAIVLLGPEAGRLIDFLVLNRPTGPADLGPVPSSRAVAWSLAGLKLVLVVGLLGYLSWDTVTQYRDHIARREKEPVAPEGNYTVDSFTRDGRKVRPPVLNPDDFEWKTFSLREGVIGIRTGFGPVRRFRAAGDITHHPTALVPLDEDSRLIPGAAPAGVLEFAATPNGGAHVTGFFVNHAVDAELQRRNASDMPLLSRGFHWVSEAPYFHMFASDKGR